MDILLVSHFFPPTHNAGTENYTLALAKALSGRGHTVGVVCAEGWEEGGNHWNGVTEERVEGIPVRRLHINWMKASDPNRMLYDNPVVESWFDEFLSGHRPDVVHVTSTVSLGVGVLRSVHRARIPLVLTLTDFWFLCPSIQLLRSDGKLCDGSTTAWDCQACLSAPSRLFHLVNRILPDSLQPSFWGRLGRIPSMTRHRGFRGMLLDVADRKRLLADHLGLPDRVLTPSISLGDLFSRNGLGDIQLLRHGHNLAWCAGYRGTEAGGELRFGYMGQIEQVKGVHLLVEAFKRLDLNARARLDIWGDLARSPEYVGSLRELAGNDPRISLRGRFERANLAAVLGGIDVLVVPSLWYENSPLVIQEAFAVGTPVVASDLGGMSEAVTHGVNGLLFQRGSASDLADQMRRVLDQPDLLPALRKGIPRVRTSEEEVAEVEALYSELTAASCPAGAFSDSN